MNMLKSNIYDNLPRIFGCHGPWRRVGEKSTQNMFKTKNHPPNRLNGKSIFGAIHHLYLEAIFYFIKMFKRSSTWLECEKCSKIRGSQRPPEQKNKNSSKSGRMINRFVAQFTIRIWRLSSIR